MKTKLFAAALAALTMAAAGAASAQDYRRGNDDWRHGDYDRRGRQEITIRKDGRVMQFDRGDRMFYRLQERPFNFRPGYTYAYTDRCNRHGCIAFVFNGRSMRPIDRIFAPRLPDRRFTWREVRGFDSDYNRFGRYDRDERDWNNEDDRNFRIERDRGRLEGGAHR